MTEQMKHQVREAVKNGYDINRVVFDLLAASGVAPARVSLEDWKQLVVEAHRAAKGLRAA